MTRPTLFALALAGFAACSAENSLSEDDNDDGAWDTGTNGAPEDPDWDQNDNDEPGSEAEDDLPPLAPAQTDVYVFIANPDRDTVTRIHVQSMDVRTVPVGRDPRVVRTSQDYRHAVVFNRGDNTVSIIDAETLDVRRVPVRANFNQLVLSRNAAWSAVFHDRAAVRPGDPAPTGLQSFNEVSFVHLETGRHVPLAVGYNPRSVQFTNDGTTAVVVTDEFLAVIDLTETNPRPRMIQVAEDLLDAPLAEEVVLSNSGDWAFVRQFGANTLAVVDLGSEELTRVPVGANPTDLDLTPDGRHAVVVSRDDRQLWVFDTQNPLTVAPEILGLPGEDPLGSVIIDPSGKQGILYTTASPVARYASWDLASGEIVLRSLVKPVKGVAVTPTGTSLMVFHTLTDAPDVDPDSPFRSRWALTLIDLEDHRANPLRLPAEPIGFANDSAGTRGYFIMKNQPTLAVLDYYSLLHEEIRLRSTPVFVGVLPDLDPDDNDTPRAWASQEHTLGRISLYDADDGSLETITGFELNSQIED